MAKGGASEIIWDPDSSQTPILEISSSSLEVILEAIYNAGYKIGQNIFLALDAAASEFYKDGIYHLSSENLALSAEEMVEYWQTLVGKYPIVSIEDGLDESDWDGWAILTAKIGDKVQLVGDDLFVTNAKILSRGIDAGVANSILIKVNQIGTLTETLEAIRMARAAGYSSVISHRSGRQRIQQLQTLLLQPQQAKSKRDRCVDQTGLQNIISYSESKMPLMRFIRVSRSSNDR